MPRHGIGRAPCWVCEAGQQVAVSDSAAESSGVAVGVGVLDDFLVLVGVGTFFTLFFLQLLSY